MAFRSQTWRWNAFAEATGNSSNLSANPCDNPGGTKYALAITLHPDRHNGSVSLHKAEPGQRGLFGSRSMVWKRQVESGIRAARGCATTLCNLTNLHSFAQPLTGTGRATALAALPLTCTCPPPRDSVSPRLPWHAWCVLGPTNNGHRGRNGCSHPLRKGNSTSSRACSVWHTTARLPSCVGSRYLSPRGGHGALSDVPHCTGMRELSLPPDLSCVRGSCSPHV